jgi:hypothetical protein
MKNKILLELVSWLFTAVIAVGILFPIWSKVTEYPERINYYNLVYIVVFVTFTRYIFLLRYTFLAEMDKVKALLIALSVPTIILLIDGIFTFRQMVDNDGYEAICKGVTSEQLNTIGLYYRNEYIFFGVAAVISAVAFPVRMVVSIWRRKNRGTV